MTPTPPDLTLAQQVVRDCTHTLSRAHLAPDSFSSLGAREGACAPCLAQALGRVRVREQQRCLAIIEQEGVLLCVAHALTYQEGKGNPHQCEGVTCADYERLKRIETEICKPSDAHA